MKATKSVFLFVFFSELLYIPYNLIAVPFILKKDQFSLRTEIDKLYRHKAELISIIEPFIQER